MKKEKFLFDLIIHVQSIIYLDLSRCLSELVPCDSEMKKWTLHNITGAHTKWFKTGWLIYKRHVSEKPPSSSAGVSQRILLCLCYHEPYLQMNVSLNLENGGLEKIDEVGTQAGLCELVEFWGGKRKRISLYGQTKKKSRGERSEPTM